jgi:site-specific DNA recombinase
MKEIIGYIRVSTKRQVKHGNSLVAQKEVIKVAAMKDDEDPEQITFLSDEGISGGNRNRKEYQLLKKMVEEDRVSSVYIYSISRLGRDLLEMLQFIELCEEKGVRVVSATDNYHSDKPETKLYLHILGAIADQQKREYGVRIKAGIEKAKQKGKKYTNKIPIGKEVKSGKLVKSDRDKRIITHIKNLKTRGKSYQQIADYFNEKGIKTKYNKIWSRQLVYNWVKSSEKNNV